MVVSGPYCTELSDLVARLGLGTHSSSSIRPNSSSAHRSCSAVYLGHSDLGTRPNPSPCFAVDLGSAEHPGWLNRLERLDVWDSPDWRDHQRRVAGNRSCDA